MKLGLFFLSVLGMVAGVAVETSSLLGNVLSPIPSGIDIKNLRKIVKNSTSTKLFFEALSGADPKNVRKIIALLEQLAAVSFKAKGELEIAVSDAATALALAQDSLNNAYHDAFDADTALSTAQAIQAKAEKAKVAQDLLTVKAESHRDTAQTAKDIADKALRNEGPGYDDEHAIIFHVIKMLKSLISEEDGGWELGLNINPCDGGNFGYGGPWAPDNDVGSADHAFTRDFVDVEVWKKTVSFVTIARHVTGECTMSKTWELTDKTKSMYDYFSSGASIFATGDGSKNDNHISSDIPDSADGLDGEYKDPIFGAEGGLLFNFEYGDNGARIVIPGGYKIPYSLGGAANCNDCVHGLGNDFYWVGGGSGAWWHDVAEIGPDNYHVVGTDSGTALANGPCWGSYAIFVSQNTRSFNCQGQTFV